MLRYKGKILERLKERGYPLPRVRKERIFGQKTIQDFRTKAVIPYKAINRLCKILGCQPGDIMEYVPDDSTEIETVPEKLEQTSTPPRWIPVGERLPELGVKVLCYCKAFSPPAGREVWTVVELTRRELDVDAPDEAFVGVFWFDSWGFPVDYEVTHWMPRPEKPGMEGQKEES